MMANVLNPTLDFHPRPSSRSPSSFGFGFALGPSNPLSMSSPGWGAATTPGHTNLASFHQLASSVTQSASNRPQKRRLDVEDEGESRRPSSRDESMDRSPTPERPKRAAPKRARVVVNTSDHISKGTTVKGNKTPGDPDDDDVDIGVLLASLPPQSLLPLLSALLKEQPSLKSTILPLIPRPTLEVAVEALLQAARKLRDAYPYSSTTSFSPSLHHTFGSSSPVNAPPMRDSYVISRLRPHISDYVSTCMSYFPYFSCIPSPTQSATTSTLSTTNSATTIQSLHKDKFHPSETFIFLSAVTSQILEQPTLTLGEMVPMILPRLAEEWKTWVDKIDEVVNRQGGMFGSETVKNWERTLDELVESKSPAVSQVMRGIRDRWISKVGWLAGRLPQHAMDV